MVLVGLSAAGAGINVIGRGGLLAGIRVGDGVHMGRYHPVMAQRVDDLRVAVPALGAGRDLQAGQGAVGRLLHVLLIGMLTGGGAGGALQLGEDGVQTFQYRRQVQLLIQPRLERLQPCEDITAAGDIRGRSAGIGVPLFAADGALVERMALGGHVPSEL